MSDGAELVVDALATYRLTRLAVTDTFPPVQAVRQRLLQRWPANSWQVELLTCPWCLSMWAGLGVVILRRVRFPGWRLLARALAFSAVTGALAEKV